MEPVVEAPVSENEPAVDIQAEACRFGEQTSTSKKIKVYSSNIKTGQTEGVRKVYDVKNGDEIFIMLCPKCARGGGKALHDSSLPKPVFKLTVDLLDIAVEANSDNELVATYSSVSSGEVFQRKILSAKKLRQSLADLVFGRPAPLTMQLVVKQGSLGSLKVAAITEEHFDRQLRYFLALL